ncbi:uncharacterized protein MAM_00813 [Metarhizium album ARSEF 1941]|uniref:Uncharacterized protein n=1 Tax=Metarhizium album (strain ARSEF 1941) TaxID=1081103 RepID=A0A0B2WZX5_METAS|nr:uncharacterized protein MAM_00813 [Metarhizium album ARSEF 1941]KHO01812.1 hypothetical protein MAM_00813 [Metarhizium album ARSEF 1941]
MEVSEPPSQLEFCSSDDYNYMGFELELAMIDEMQTLEKNQIASSNSVALEEFQFDDTDDAEFEALLEQKMDTSVGENPPSSVVRAFDIESKFAEDYDPDLQFSSPQTNQSRATIGSSTSIPSTETVDWEDIRQQASKSRQEGGGIYGERQVDHMPPSKLHCIHSLPSPQPSASLPQASWTACPVNMRMFNPSRTCFRLSEITESKAAMVQRQPHAVYNVFARVLYSSRENFFRRQYFQLRDLLSESPPYLTGALLG